MKDDQAVVIIEAAMKENIFTVMAAALCVGLLAIGTGSLHSLWGLIILINLNSPKIAEEK